MDGWDSFYLAEAGAAAALAGLLFVSISISLDHILAYPSLIDRSLQALAVLAHVLVVASLCLVPGQSATLLGAEILAISLVMWLILLRFNLSAWRVTDPPRSGKTIWHVLLSQGSATLYPLAGGLLMLQVPGAAYLLVPAVLLSFLLAFADAWVLLVEVRR